MQAVDGEASFGRVLVLMPTAHDSERSLALLRDAHVAATACVELAGLCRELRSGADAILVTEEAILDDSSGHLAEALREQPPWSAVPILVLARGDSMQQLQQTAPEAFGTLIVVERPVRTHMLLSMVRSALRMRRQQRQVRDAILVREEQAEALQAQEERLRLALAEHQRMNEALRSSELALERQAEQLRSADRRKDEFLATLAHELRNPLAPIRTGVDLLSGSPAPEVTERTLGVMKRQVSHMVRLIDDLLDVSRITRGKVELRRDRVTLGVIIDAAVEASRPLIDRGRHALKVTVEDESLVLDADLTRVAQIVSNLLNNASKYTASGGSIELSAVRAGSTARIEVRDDGVGIPEDQLGHVFEMFSQVNRALERSQGGLGIGLALVQSLVQMHGGSVTAASAGLDRGSTFTVTLPLAEELEAPPVSSAPAAPAEGRRELRVLVVDDNDDAAELLALSLEQAGYQAITAYDGPSALSSVESFSPDVVILDIGLPGMSGYDVAKELRRRGRVELRALIALTGLGTREDKERATRAGFDLHLTKPINAEILRSALEDISRSKRAPAVRPAIG